MDLKTRLKNVSVIGAAGKMGSGIALLAAQELAFQALENPGEEFILNLIDVNDSSLLGLQKYIKDQCRKTAEKQVPRLRILYASREDLVDNGDMVDEFVHEVLSHIRMGKTLELAKDSLTVFEAALEREDLKFELFSSLERICPKEAFFLTNTSSIPLEVIAKATGVEGRIIGYHFYNPPAIQKLVELITPKVCRDDLVSFSKELAKRLSKKIVPANDVAGFIGNGHFMRDGLHAISQVEKLAAEHGFVQSVYMLDKVSRDYLMRPMGIFQLIDYVGVDVFQCILKVMDKYLPGQGLHSALVDRLMAMGVKGGQTSSGAQKDGFLKYEKNRPAGVFDVEKGEYVPFTQFSGQADAALGEHPTPGMDWKGLQRDPQKDSKIAAHFTACAASSTLGASLALQYARASKQAGELLVNSGVAADRNDVNSVLMLGFFHLYGPINDMV